jgi:hypothetical protein
MGGLNHNLQHEKPSESESETLLALATSNRGSGPRNGNFLNGPKLFLSDQTYSNRSEYDFLQVWFNIIDHNMSIKGVKVDIFFPGTFCRWFLLGK